MMLENMLEVRRGRNPYVLLGWLPEGRRPSEVGWRGYPAKVPSLSLESLAANSSVTSVPYRMLEIMSLLREDGTSGVAINAQDLSLAELEELNGFKPARLWIRAYAPKGWYFETDTVEEMEAVLKNWFSSLTGSGPFGTRVDVVIGVPEKGDALNLRLLVSPLSPSTSPSSEIGRALFLERREIVKRLEKDKWVFIKQKKVQIEAVIWNLLEHGQCSKEYLKRSIALNDDEEQLIARSP